jgi:hypothetical protein
VLSRDQSRSGLQMHRHEKLFRRERHAQLDRGRIAAGLYAGLFWAHTWAIVREHNESWCHAASGFLLPTRG